MFYATLQHPLFKTTVRTNRIAHRMLQDSIVTAQGISVPLLSTLTIKAHKEEIPISKVLSKAEAPPRWDGITETAFAVALANTGAKPIA